MIKDDLDLTISLDENGLPSDDSSDSINESNFDGKNHPEIVSPLYKFQSDNLPTGQPTIPNSGQLSNPEKKEHTPMTVSRPPDNIPNPDSHRYIKIPTGTEIGRTAYIRNIDTLKASFGKAQKIMNESIEALEALTSMQIVDDDKTVQGMIESQLLMQEMQLTEDLYFEAAKDPNKTKIKETITKIKAHRNMVNDLGSSALINFNDGRYVGKIIPVSKVYTFFNKINLINVATGASFKITMWKTVGLTFIEKGKEKETLDKMNKEHAEILGDDLEFTVGRIASGRTGARSISTLLLSVLINNVNAGAMMSNIISLINDNAFPNKLYVVMVTSKDSKEKIEFKHSITDKQLKDAAEKAIPEKKLKEAEEKDSKK